MVSLAVPHSLDHPQSFREELQEQAEATCLLKQCENRYPDSQGSINKTLIVQLARVCIIHIYYLLIMGLSEPLSHWNVDCISLTLPGTERGKYFWEAVKWAFRKQARPSHGQLRPGGELSRAEHHVLRGCCRRRRRVHEHPATCTCCTSRVWLAVCEACRRSEVDQDVPCAAEIGEHRQS